MKRYSKFIGFLMISVLIVAMFQWSGVAATPTYRAYLVAVPNTVFGDPLLGPGSDLLRVDKMLNMQTAPYQVTKGLNPTKTEVLAGISANLGAATDNDVSVFYYSGHGGISGGNPFLCPADAVLYMSELESALDQIKGEKIVIIDACFSGSFIQKGAQSQDFNRSVIATFATPTSKALNKPKYRVITAASGTQFSSDFPFSLKYKWNNFEMGGLDLELNGWGGEFTNMLLVGSVPVNVNKANNISLPAMADVNQDRVISMNELTRYLRASVLRSDVQFYDPQPDTALFELAQAVNVPESMINMTDLENLKAGASIRTKMPISGAFSLQLFRNCVMNDYGQLQYDAVKTFANNEAVSLGASTYSYNGIDDSGLQMLQGEHTLIATLNGVWVPFGAVVNAIANSLPTVSDIYVDHNALSSGSTLTASYTFNDADGDQDSSVLQWYRMDSLQSALEPISGANSKRYTLTDEDIGKYINLAVIPYDNKGYGDMSFSSAIGPVEAATSAKLMLNGGTAKVGDIILVPITINDNYTASSLQFGVTFDSAVLEYTGNQIPTNSTNAIYDINAAQTNIIKYAVAQGSPIWSAQDNTIITLLFKVKDTQSTKTALQLVDYYVFDQNGVQINTEATNGEIALSPSTIKMGDVNGDGLVTPSDATEVLMYYAGLKSLEDSQKQAADVSGDGKVTPTDATTILMMYANLY